jgi:hypothetical protein
MLVLEPPLQCGSASRPPSWMNARQLGRIVISLKKRPQGLNCRTVEDLRVHSEVCEVSGFLL